MATGRAGTTIFGPEGFSFFGARVAAVGDVNGDGVADFAVAARQAGDGYPLGASDSLDQVGVVYVVYGRDGAELPETLDFGFDAALAPDGTSFSVIQGAAAGDRLGWDVAAAGDLNGDGIDDLVAGSDRMGEPSNDGGAVVIYGAAGGLDPVIEVDALTAAQGARLNGQANAQAGLDLSGAGDLDGDGADDLFVSSQNDSRVYVVFGSDAEALPAEAVLGTDLGPRTLTIEGVTSNGGGAVGDVTGDGVADLVLPGSGNDLLILEGGAALAALGRGSVALGDLAPFATIADGRTFGIGDAGDVNGDGVGDLVVAGAVVFGGAGLSGATVDLSALDGRDGFRFAPAGQNFNVGGRGDVNGDGIGDLVLGDRRGDGPGGETDVGRTYLVFGRTGGFPADLDLEALDGTDGYRIEGTFERDVLDGGRLADVNGEIGRAHV